MARSLLFRPRYAVLVASILAVIAALVPCAAQAADSHATPSTFASLFSSAQGGDTVFLAAGNYGSFNGGQKSSVVTVKPEPGASVSIAGGTFSGSSNITVMGVSFGTSQVVVSSGSTGITFDNDVWGAYNAGGSYEGRLSVVQGAKVTVKNSKFGPGGCADGIQASGGGQAAGEVIVDNTEFVGIRQGNCAAHVDPIQLYGGVLTLTNSYFHDDSTGIMSPDCNGAVPVMKNNVFVMDEYPWALVGGGLKNAAVTHNVVVGATLLFAAGNGGCGNATGNTVRDNVADINAQSGNTIDHNLQSSQVSFTGGAARCGYASTSPKSTASDGTDIGLNSCNGSPSPPPPPADDHLGPG
jgi:hypothetical protein